MTPVLLAFDEGPGIGLGHRRRLEALAAVLRELGVATAVCRIGPEPVVGDVVVVDSYRHRADDPARFDARTIVAVDDVARDLGVDVVVDPDPGADACAHRRAGAVLLGPQYALVDPALAADPPPVRSPVARVLVTTGGADAAGIGARVGSELADALPYARVRLVVGPWGRAVADDRVDVVPAPAGLASELAAADVVVTAGGVTMLEACALGRPTVAFAIADNQSRSLAGAASVGAVARADASSAAAVAARLALDDTARERLAVAARQLVDGQGAARVAAAVAAIARQGVQSR